MCEALLWRRSRSTAKHPVRDTRRVSNPQMGFDEILLIINYMILLSVN